jgi:hypothetical protein
MGGHRIVLGPRSLSRSLSSEILTKENENEERDRLDPKADLRPNEQVRAVGTDFSLRPTGGWLDLEA